MFSGDLFALKLIDYKSVVVGKKEVMVLWGGMWLRR